MKILNLYSGLGGNRLHWPPEHEITAIEINPRIASVYASIFPEDNLILGDAHEYLIEHFTEYDFIWSSPPCPSHSTARRGYKPTYPDMSLYQEILLLEGLFKGKWIVENVTPYYTPILKPKKIGRNQFWSNFNIGNFKAEKIPKFESMGINALSELHGINIKSMKDTFVNKRQCLRNCVDPILGLHILNSAMDIITHENINQFHIFE